MKINDCIDDLKKVIESSNISFLFGAGTSSPFLPLLSDIEVRLDQAQTQQEKEEIYKEYLQKVMLPNKVISSNDFVNFPTGYWDGDTTEWIEHNPEISKSNFSETTTAYEEFFKIILKILIKRKSTILSKQATIFTTNIDILLETTLEKLRIDYSDGFLGKNKPSFSIANYKKTISQRSLHFEHISEIPTFSIIKMHGSLSWEYGESDEIIYSHTLDHINNELLDLSGESFAEQYKKIAVVNPEESKHLESVLNVYYSELLRLLSSELEKENALLFVVGFSMKDKHLKHLIFRALKSNPTLRVYVFCHSANEYSSMKSRLDVSSYPNLVLLSPDDTQDENKLSLTKVTDELFKKIISKEVEDDE
jgi:hypothetical protein